MKLFSPSAIILTVFLLVFTIVSAQTDDQNQMISPDGDTVLITPVPLADITSAIESTYEKTKKIEGRLEPNPDLIKFDSLYQIAIVGLELAKTKLESREDFSSVREIEDILKEWKSYADILNEYKTKVNSRIKSLEEDQFEVSVRNKIWKITLVNAKEGGVPADVLTSVQDLSNKLKALQKDVKNKQNEALSKQNRITELLLLIDEVMTFLEDKRKELQSDYFRLDSPPIWAASDSTAQFVNVKHQIGNSLNDAWRNLEIFYQSNSTTLVVHLLLFIFLWLGFYYLDKQATLMENGDGKLNLDQARNVVSKHALSALAISLFLSIWIYPTLVTTVNDLIQFLFLIVALFFLPSYVGNKIRPILVAVILLFFLNELQVFLSSRFLFSRLVIFVECFFAGWILYRVVSPRYLLAQRLRSQSWGVIIKLAPIFYIFLAASVIGNIIGMVNLAFLLSNTVVNAIFNLIILVLVVTVLIRATSILLRTPFMQSSNIIKEHLYIIEKRLGGLFKIVGIFLWLKSVLGLLGLYEDVLEWLTVLLETKWEVGQSSIALYGIIGFIIAVLGTVLVYRTVKILLKEELYPRVHLPRGVPGAISMIVGYVIAGYGIYISIGAAGINLGTFGLIAGALGVGIGFGLQGIVANFIAGLVMAFERPIQVGDAIQMNNVEGIVLSIGVRSTTIRTYDGSEVIIPNSTIITDNVINWTLTDRKKRRDISINVAYGSNPHEVMDLIKRVAEEDPNVLKIPAPWALFDGFGDNSLNFRVRVWTTMDNGMTVRSAVAIAIYDALEDAGIEIPFPQRDLHLRSIDPSIKQFGTVTTAQSAKKRVTKKRPAKKIPEGEDKTPKPEKNS